MATVFIVVVSLLFVVEYPEKCGSLLKGISNFNPCSVSLPQNHVIILHILSCRILASSKTSEYLRNTSNFYRTNGLG
jgi:hypothetical protein